MDTTDRGHRGSAAPEDDGSGARDGESLLRSHPSLTVTSHGLGLTWEVFTRFHEMKVNCNSRVVHKYKKRLPNSKAYRRHYLSLTVAWCYWPVRLVATVLRSEHWPERTVLRRKCSASRKAIWRRSWITGSQPWIRPTWWVPSRCIPTHSATYL